MARLQDEHDTVVERFHATSGRVTGWLAIALAAVVVLAGLAYRDEGFPAWVTGAALLGGVVAWAAMLRPALWVTDEHLVMRNLAETVHIRLAADATTQKSHMMPVTPTEQQEAVERFLAAVRSGDLQSLLEVLAPDVVIVADGGGVVAAARRPIVGAERVAALLMGLAQLADFEAGTVWLNGSPAGRLDIGGAVDTAVSFSVENGRITRIYAVRNPHKLAGLERVATLSRT